MSKKNGTTKAAPTTTPGALTLADVRIEWTDDHVPFALTGAQAAKLLAFAVGRWRDYRKRIGEDAISGCFEHMTDPDSIGIELSSVSGGLSDIVGDHADDAIETAFNMEILQLDALGRLNAATAPPATSFRLVTVGGAA